MKQLLVILITLIAFFSSAQFPKEIKEFYNVTYIDLHHQFKFQHGDAKLEEAFFKLTYKDTGSVLYGKDYAKTFKTYYEDKKNTTQIKDFDFDGDLDVLFNGRQMPAVENYNIIMFLNKGKYYEPVHMGIWIDTMYSDSSKYYFLTSQFWPVETSTCSMEFEIYKSKPNQISLISNELFSYYSPEDSLIKKIDMKVKFPKEKEFYFQPNPDLSSIQKYDLDNDQIIGTIPANLECQAYDYVILDGKIWYYLVLSIEEELNLISYYQKNSYGEYKYIRGWICGD